MKRTYNFVVYIYPSELVAPESFARTLIELGFKEYSVLKIVVPASSRSVVETRCKSICKVLSTSTQIHYSYSIC